MIAQPIVFRITITVIIASPLRSGYVSIQYVIQVVIVAALAAAWTNAANASPNPRKVSVTLQSSFHLSLDERRFDLQWM